MALRAVLLVWLGASALSQPSLGAPDSPTCAFPPVHVDLGGGRGLHLDTSASAQTPFLANIILRLRSPVLILCLDLCLWPWHWVYESYSPSWLSPASWGLPTAEPGRYSGTWSRAEIYTIFRYGQGPRPQALHLRELQSGPPLGLPLPMECGIGMTPETRVPLLSPTLPAFPAFQNELASSQSSRLNWLSALLPSADSLLGLTFFLLQR